MAIGEMPLFSMLRTKMKWHSTRQNVLAENVANADVPGYRGQDVAEVKFNVPVSLGPQRTNPMHIGAGGATGDQADLFNRNDSQIFEITPQGNSVSLEDEMIKVGQNQQDYQAVAGLYQSSLGLLRTALGKRG
ncbi:MAG: flagellar basal body protein [Pseudomonadota bacterium]